MSRLTDHLSQLGSESALVALGKLAAIAFVAGAVLMLAGTFWCAVAALAAGFAFARHRWPSVRLASYFRGRRLALPVALAVGGIGTQYVIATLLPSLSIVSGSTAALLAGGTVAAVALGIVIAVFDHRLMRETFDAVPSDPQPLPLPGQPSQEQALATPPAPANPVAAARLTFADLCGNDELKSTLLDAANKWREKGKNGILLSGAPGGGKTAFAEALAGELGVGFLKMTFGRIASSWVNKSTEQFVQAVTDALAQQPCVLFIDEVDAILAQRGGSPGYAEYDKLVTEFLDRAVSLRGTGVLLVAATNYIDKLDEAAIREGRFDFKIEVPLPDAPARRGLIDSTLTKYHCAIDEDTATRLTKRWGGFNVPRIIEVTERACETVRAAAGLQDRPGEGEPETAVAIEYPAFYKALRSVQGRKGGAPEGAKALSELFLDDGIAERLQNVATQLVDVDEVEKRGGSIPKGILFSGLPGTGKTATAMALARECGWSFIQRTGRQLLESGAIAALGKEASDLRPAIVFIDEADDILGDRQMSPYKSATNELLTLIDGAGGMLQDIVWIAATNHPQSMDSAATRGGRFGQRIEFAAPSRETAERLIAAWLRSKTAADAVVIDVPPETWAGSVADALTGFVPADIYQTLDTANNVAITDEVRGDGTRTLTVARVAEAAEELRSQRKTGTPTDPASAALAALAGGVRA